MAFLSMCKTIGYYLSGAQCQPVICGQIVVDVGASHLGIRDQVDPLMRSLQQRVDDCSRITDEKDHLELAPDHGLWVTERSNEFSATRIQYNLFHIWPFTTMKFWPITKNC